MARPNMRRDHAESSRRRSMKQRKTKVLRNRASPARLTKLYKYQSIDQQKIIGTSEFDGLLMIACDSIPVEFADWLMTDCFDAETMHLILLGRGRIAVSEESVARILGLPNKGEVKYELDAKAIEFMQEKYGFPKGTSAPQISTIVKRLMESKEADDDYLRSWLMLAISTFLCPPASLGISPRCYPALIELSQVRNLNWCKFVTDRLKTAALKMNKRNSVKGCLLYIVILHVDSLTNHGLDIPTTKPRVGAWSGKLLRKAIKLDTNPDGSFGRHMLKDSGNGSVQTSYFFQMDDIRRFISSKAGPRTSSEEKKEID